MNGPQNTLSKRLIIYILLISSLITLVLTLIQLNINYRYDLNLIEQRFQQIKLSNIQSITQDVWTVNEIALEKELKSILKIPDITSVKFHYFNTERPSIELGRVDEHIRQLNLPIVYEYRDKKIPLGVLNITASLSNVYQRLIDTASIIFLSQALKTFIVSLFIFLLFKNFITRHLSKIAHFLEDKNLITQTHTLVLDRATNKWTKNDELDTVTMSINTMLANMRKMVNTLYTTQKTLLHAQELSHTAHWEYDPNSKTIHLNPQTIKLLKFKSHQQQIKLDDYLQVLHPSDRIEFNEQLQLAQKQALNPSFQVRVQQRGEPVLTFFQEIKKMHPDKSNSLLLGSMQDISKLVEHQKKLEHLANVDVLTALPNRNNFHIQLENRLKELNQNPQQPFAVLIADLDRFKEINDSLGHYAGDQLLKDIGPRFIQTLGNQDFVARLGGDEFAFIIEGDLHTVQNFVNSMCAKVAEPFVISGLNLSVGISVGIALAPLHTQDASDLLRFADIAMYNAKKRRSVSKVYSNETDVHGVRRLALMTELKTAISNNQLTLYYQPKIRLNNPKSRCGGVEALIRWNHPEYGVVPPDDFIPFAEMSDLISPLTLWVIKQAIADNKAIREHIPGCITSINISSRNLHDQNFPNQIKALLIDHQVKAEQFILEITESAIMEYPKRAEASISKLYDMGFTISIDDFGTGYSSLAYLKNLPVSELKIDRTFVSDMIQDNSDFTIVKSTIDLAHNLGLAVTAEGVETKEIEAALISLNCDTTQGYFYSKPIPLAEFIEWVKLQKMN